MILITGGSGSGKSEYAEGRVISYGDNTERYYIATMMPFGEEGKQRIKKHRLMRGEKDFQTVECYTEIEKLQLPTKNNKQKVVLLECVSNLVANEMFSCKNSKEDIVEEVVLGILQLETMCDYLVVVTNEIAHDCFAYEIETKQYQNTLGRINQRLAKEASEVIEVVFGIPIWSKRAGGKKDA